MWSSAARLLYVWSDLQQHVTEQWRGRLHACVRTVGRHFKYVC